MTPVSVVQFTFVLRPRVGSETGKVAVLANLRLSYETTVSYFAILETLIRMQLAPHTSK